MLHGHGLKTIGSDLYPLPGHRELPSNNQPAASDDVTGEVRDRHTTLSASLFASRTDDHGVAQDKRSVTCAGLGMVGHVNAEYLCGDADLLCG
jgi:hypothetical protein